MAIVRYSVGIGEHAPAVRSTPEGSGTALVVVDIETDYADDARERDGLFRSTHVINALRKVLQAIKDQSDGKGGGNQL